MKPNRFFACLAMLMSPCAAAVAQPVMMTSAPRVSSRPNVVLVTLTGQAGENAAKLAAEGTTFSQCFAASAAAGPFQEALVTGRYPGQGRHGVRLPSYLHHNEYYTVLVQSRPGAIVDAWDVVRNEYPSQQRAYNRAPGALSRALKTDISASVYNGLQLFVYAPGVDDAALGEILKAIEEGGNAVMTLVVVVGMPGKEAPFTPEGMRVAVTVRWPVRIAAGVKDEATLLSTADVAPTIVDVVTGLAPLRDIDGKSFYRLMMGMDKQGGHDYVYSASGRDHWGTQQRAVTDGKYGYIYAFGRPQQAEAAKPVSIAAAQGPGPVMAPRQGMERHGMCCGGTHPQKDLKPAEKAGEMVSATPQVQLYDLVKDPGCTKNLAEDAAMKETAAKYNALLKKQMQEVCDPLSRSL